MRVFDESEDDSVSYADWYVRACRGSSMRDDADGMSGADALKLMAWTRGIGSTLFRAKYLLDAAEVRKLEEHLAEFLSRRRPKLSHAQVSSSVREAVIDNFADFCMSCNGTGWIYKGDGEERDACGNCGGYGVRDVSGMSDPAKLVFNYMMEIERETSKQAMRRL